MVYPKLFISDNIDAVVKKCEDLIWDVQAEKKYLRGTEKFFYLSQHC